jgi:DNA-binding response OmpR family regulator
VGGSTATLLVIEDDEALRALVQRAGTQAGLEVLSAVDGEEGLKLATERLPDIILLDIMLPNLDGRDVLKRLKENPVTKEIPVIILSARTGHVDRLVGLELGAHDYLTKPYSVQILLNRIDNILWNRDRP